MLIDRTQYPKLHSKLKIMVVDDMETSRRMLKATLGRLGFKKVSTAASVEEAMKIFKKANSKDEAFDLICTDINMPKVTGLEFLRQLKENPTTKNTPVLMISAEDDTETILKAVDLGASNYILKPFSEKLLAEKLISIFYG